ERIYGRSHLPVKYSQPHMACTQRWGDAPVYYLDVSAVPDALLDRLAVFEARRLGISYPEARIAVRHEWLIRADDCKLEKHVPDGASSWQPSFPFLQNVSLRLNPKPQPKYLPV
ncbi:MAG: hypothetical protein GY796_09875, partial [Chloroflexi bacterium]|nr:hypothetical protein [Chloroflexota bacterium]